MTPASQAAQPRLSKTSCCAAFQATALTLVNCARASRSAWNSSKSTPHCTFSGATLCVLGRFTCRPSSVGRTSSPLDSARAIRKSQSVAPYCTSSRCFTSVASTIAARPYSPTRLSMAWLSVLSTKTRLRRLTVTAARRMPALDDDPAAVVAVDAHAQLDDDAHEDCLWLVVAIASAYPNRCTRREGRSVGDGPAFSGHIAIAELDASTGDLANGAAHVPHRDHLPQSLRSHCRCSRCRSG